MEIAKRSDRAEGFIGLPKRWVVAGALAWRGRCRRLAKDWEARNHKARAFLIMASIRFYGQAAMPQLGMISDRLSIQIMRRRVGAASDSLNGARRPCHP